MPDQQLDNLIADDLLEQRDLLSLLPAGGIAPPAVLACTGSALANRTAEGYPMRRLHAGCRIVDEIELLAQRRALQAFRAQYANVQPQSGSVANWSVYAGLLAPGHTVLVPDPVCAGAFQHGWATSLTSRHYQQLSYGLDGVGRVDYKQVRWLAHRHRPKLIICAAGSYPRTPDFAQFRAIADEVGAYLMADISNAAGLVVAGAHPSPINHAHVTTCSTGGLLGLPHAGLLISGKDADAPTADGHTSLRKVLDRAVFPLTQAAADPSAIAAKAAILANATSPRFRELANTAVANARALATRLFDLGHEVVTYGTENHLVLLNVMAEGITGAVAEDALASCGIMTSRCRVPFDVKPPQLGSGLRIGATVATIRGMGPADMVGCADLIDSLLRAIKPRSDTVYTVPDPVRLKARESVRTLCRYFPVPDYPKRTSAPPELAKVS